LLRCSIAVPQPLLSTRRVMSIQLTDIVAFTTLVSAAVLWRKQPAAHKRLMLLATLYISDAGFSRWLASTVGAHVGNGFWGTVMQLYLANDLLIIGLGVYDWITRRRLHVMYVAGVVWIATIQFTSITLYLDPLWKGLPVKLLGH
jgi:hypothetical protein